MMCIGSSAGASHQLPDKVDHRIRPCEIPWVEDSQIRIPVHLVLKFRSFADEEPHEMTGSGEQGSDLAPDHSAAAGDEDVLALE